MLDIENLNFLPFEDMKEIAKSAKKRERLTRLVRQPDGSYCVVFINENDEKETEAYNG